MSWTTPAAAPAGAALTSIFWDAQVKGNLDAIGGAWTSWTPTVSGWTLGNGTLACAYAKAGRLVHFRARVTVGGTTVTAAALNLTLPTPPHASFAGAYRYVARDVSVGSFFGDTDLLGEFGVLGLQATNLFTYVAGDFIGVAGTYEAAS